VDASGVTVRNLHHEALLLHDNTPEKLRIIEQVNNLLQQRGVLGWLRRGLYWMFNVEHYRTNYYTLQGYFSWRIYEEGITMLSEQVQNQVKASGGFLIEPSSKNDSIVESLVTGANHVGRGVKFIAYTTLISPLRWVAKTALSHFSEKKEFPVVQLDISKTHFEVNKDMVLALKTLGIEAFTGQRLLFSSLKAAYRESCLRTHPDRTQGKHEDFIRMQSAYEELTRLIEAASGPIGLPPELKKYFSDLDEQMDELNSRYCDLRSDITHLDERLHQHCKNVEVHAINVAIHCEQQSQEIHELTDKMDFLTALLRDKGYDLQLDECQKNTSLASNPNRLFASSNTNQPEVATSDEHNLSEVDDSSNVRKQTPPG